MESDFETCFAPLGYPIAVTISMEKTDLHIGAQIPSNDDMSLSCPSLSYPKE